MISLKDFFSFKNNKAFWLNLIAMPIVVIAIIFGVLHWLGKEYIKARRRIPDRRTELEYVRLAVEGNRAAKQTLIYKYIPINERLPSSPSLEIFAINYPPP